MQLRFSLCLGHPVVVDGELELLGTLSGILIHPDTGKVEGFFVRAGGWLTAHPLFLSTADILRMTTRVYVRSHEVLSPVEDRVRLQSLLSDSRSFIGQVIRTEDGEYLGRCMDVQFDTLHFMVEWFFPKKFWRWGIPLPLSDVIEVRKDGIIVRDGKSVVDVKETKVEVPILPQIPEAA